MAIKYIYVEMTEEAGQRGFWEVSEDHPGGEVFVAPGQVCKVARTAAVKEAIADNRLQEVREPDEARSAPPRAEAPSAAASGKK